MRALSLLVLALAASCVWGQGATLVADAHVSSARPTVNSGALSNLNVGGGYTALVQFDLGTLPAGITASQISRATLRVYCNRADTPGSVSVAAVGGSWSEYGVTYAMLPAMGSTLSSVSVDVGEFAVLDVTTAVQAWVAGSSSNNGLALTSANAVVQFDSKENDLTAHAPVLEIALAATAGSVGPAGPVGATGATGAVGATGPQGVAGPVGATGSAGPAGAVGATGATGAVGAAGPQGIAGATGVAGATGAAGPQGLVGVAGSVGPTGAMGLTGSPGEKGDQGTQGIAGQAGAQGIPGATGPAGLQGPAGPAGAVGPVGLSFQGAYSSTTNYGLGNGVLWQGAGWVSLVANNHGNAPDQSPGSWAMFAVAGVNGASGTAGVAGATGATGAPGAVGATGAQGPVGATGATGSAGLVYRGAYSSVINYALGDVVLWSGAGYASLTESNHGNTPDVSPAAWGLLAAQGPAGPQGVAGPTGAQGNVGTAGPQGSAGPQGAAGPQGTQGAAGAQGLQGERGPQGDAGATGAQGPAGQAGAQGIAGPAGATGTQGAVGVTGATGAVGLAMRGAYSSSTNYAAGDGVLWQGAGWVSLADSNHGNAPDQSPTMWAMFSASGAVGAAGPQGATGSVGPAGPMGSQGTSGPQGTQGPTGNVGPQGPVGASGATGQTGAAGMNFRGPWLSGNFYSANDAVTYAGSTWLALAAGSNQQPDASPQNWTVLAQAGGAGPTGAAGSAATVSIGNVTTLAPGASATVTNTGTTQAAVLDFGIPQGAAGSSGTASSTTSSGSFAAIYHAVDYNSKYFSINLATGTLNESTSVLAWIPQGCTATRLDVNSLQSGLITVTLRTGASLATMADPTATLKCTVSTAPGSCTATGSVVIPAGNFVDFRIDSSSSTTAGVWTALSCQ